MTRAGRWLAEHESGIPAALDAHLRSAVGTEDGLDEGTEDALLAAGQRMLALAIARAPMTRAEALDVLGADALVTFALEAAADDPRRLAGRADVAMCRIAALAEEAP